MIARPLLLALCLLPATARASTTDAAPTTTGDSDSDSSGGSETSTMPPEYQPCGCRADQLGGGWSLALAGLGLLALRRRRP